MKKCKAIKPKLRLFVCAFLENNGVWDLVANKSNEVHLPLQKLLCNEDLHEITDYLTFNAKMNS